MTLEEREEYVKYRLKSAHETLEAALILIKNGFWNSAMNRLYYAAFYAVNALLVKNEIITQSHSGAKNQFSLHFIKTGKLELSHGQLFGQLSDWRQKGDYESLVDFGEDEVKPLVQPVKDLISAIEQELANES